jgi:hypothetical protein
MARLFVELYGQKYEKRFRDKTPFYVDERGREVAPPVARALDQATAKAAKVNAVEATRPRKSPRAAVELTESSSLMSARRRYLAARQRKPNSTAISEAARLARRRDIYMQAGMSFSEAAIAARGRYERG